MLKRRGAQFLVPVFLCFAMQSVVLAGSWASNPNTQDTMNSAAIFRVVVMRVDQSTYTTYEHFTVGYTGPQTLADTPMPGDTTYRHEVAGISVPGNDTTYGIIQISYGNNVWSDVGTMGFQYVP